MHWPGGLWRSPDFVKFWLGQSVSLIGSQFTLLALPLTAVLTLHASPAQMGLLGAALSAPGLLLGLVAGVWLDRARRRPVLGAANAVSAIALASIPAAALLRLLTMEQVYVVALVSGAAATFFMTAQNAFVPTLAGRVNLVEANSKLQISRTLASLVGPGLAGMVVQAVTAPIAIAFDAASFVVGAATVWWIGTAETPPQRRAGRHVFAEAVEGLLLIWRQPLMRAITLVIVGGNLFPFMTSAVFLLLFAGRLGVTPFQVGLVFASGGVSSLLGALVARPVIRYGGLGPTMVAGAALFSVGPTFTLAAALGPHRLLLPLLLASPVVGGFGLMVFNVNQVALRQAVVPDRLLGRTAAGVYVASVAAQVTDSLLGGLIGQHVSLTVALAIGTLGTTLCVLPVLLSPIPSLRTMPAEVLEASAARGGRP